MPRALSPELRFVFRLADPAAPAEELRALLRAVEDWGRLVLVAEREGALPTLWRSLKAMHAQPPAQFAVLLQARSALQDFRMSRLATRTAEALAQFRARGVPVLLLKGAAIGAYCDPSFRARQMTDVDLLVRREHLDAAHDALAASGWKHSEDARLHTLLEGWQHEAPFLDPQLPGVRLELHTAILPPDHSFDFSSDTLWADAVAAPAPFDGASLPRAELLALHAAIHFAWQHQMTFGAWRTMRGIALLAGRPGFDWSLLVDEAKRRRATSSLHWTLRLGNTLGALTVPAAAIDATRTSTPEFVCRAIERHALAPLAPGEFPESPSQFVSRYLWLAAIRPRWSGHAQAGRHDPEQQWARVMGTMSTETVAQKVARHVSGLGHWARFVRHTIVGR